MYAFVRDYQLGKTFESLEEVEAFARLRASESGHGFMGAIIEIKTYVGTKPAEVAYETVSVEDYKKAIESRKQAYLALGVVESSDDYN